MIPVARRAAAIQYAIRDVVVPATALEAEGHEILKFNIGDPLAYPGLPTPDHMIRAYATALENQVNGYGPSYGIPELRAAIAASEQGKTNGGWSCRPEDVYVTAGVTEALNLLFAAVLEPGDVVLSPGPHYPPYLAYPQLYGARTVEYRLDPEEGWRIDLDDLASKLDHSVRLLVLIDPNNPTGSVLRPEEVDAVMTLASDHPNLIVVADEIYDGLDFTGQRVSIASRAKQVPVVTLNGVSKVYFAPGWRLGYLALHDPDGRLCAIRDGLERLLRARLCPPTPAQAGYLAALEGPKDWMEAHRTRVLGQRNRCMERIASIEGIDAHRPGGAFYLFMRITHPKYASDDRSFVLDLLHQEHVLLVHGSGFSPTHGVGHARLVFLPPLEVIDEAFDRIDRFLSRI